MRELFLCIVTAIAFAYVVVQWVSGCGETYTDSQGVTHVIEC